MECRYVYKYSDTGEHFSIDAESSIEANIKADKRAKGESLCYGYPKLAMILAGAERRKQYRAFKILEDRRCVSA